MIILEKIMKENLLARVVSLSLFLLLFNFCAINSASAAAFKVDGVPATEVNLAVGETKTVTVDYSFLPPSTALESQFFAFPLGAISVVEAAAGDSLPIMSDPSGEASIDYTVTGLVATTSSGSFSAIAHDVGDPSTIRASGGLPLNIGAAASVTVLDTNLVELGPGGIALEVAQIRTIIIEATGLEAYNGQTVGVAAATAGVTGVTVTPMSSTPTVVAGEVSVTTVVAAGAVADGTGTLDITVSDSGGGTIVVGSVTLRIPKVRFKIGGVAVTSATIEQGETIPATLSAEGLLADTSHTLLSFLSDDLSVNDDALVVTSDSGGNIGDTAISLTASLTATPTTSGFWSVSAADSGGTVTANSISITINAAGSATIEVFDENGTKLTGPLSIQAGDNTTVTVTGNGLTPAQDYILDGTSMMPADASVSPPSATLTANSAGEISQVFAISVSSTAPGGAVTVSFTLKTISMVLLDTFNMILDIIGAEKVLFFVDLIGNVLSRLPDLTPGDSTSIRVGGNNFPPNSNIALSLTSDPVGFVTISPSSNVTVSTDLAGSFLGSITLIEASPTADPGSYTITVTDDDSPPFEETIDGSIVSQLGPRTILVDPQTGKELNDGIIVLAFTSNVPKKMRFANLDTDEDEIDIRVELIGIELEESAPNTGEFDGVLYDTSTGLSEEIDVSFNNGRAGSGTLRTTASDSSGVLSVDNTSYQVMDLLMIETDADGIPIEVQVDLEDEDSIRVSYLDSAPDETTDVAFSSTTSGIDFTPIETTVESGQFTGDFQIPLDISLDSSVPAGNYEILATVDQACNRIGTFPISVQAGGDPPEPRFRIVAEEGKNEESPLEVSVGESKKFCAIPLNINFTGPLPANFVASIVPDNPANISFEPTADIIELPGELFKFTATGIAAGNGTFDFLFTTNAGTQLINEQGNYNVNGVVSPECSDELDNDGNNEVDFPDDCGCHSSSDNNESAPDLFFSVLLNGQEVDPIIIDANQGTGNPVTVTVQILGGDPGSTATINPPTLANSSNPDPIAQFSETAPTVVTFNEEGVATHEIDITGLREGDANINFQIVSKCLALTNSSVKLQVGSPVSAVFRNAGGNQIQPLPIDSDDLAIDAEIFGLEAVVPNGAKFAVNCSDQQTAGASIQQTVSSVSINPSLVVPGASSSVRTTIVPEINPLLEPGFYLVDCLFEVSDRDNLTKIFEETFSLRIDIPSVPVLSVETFGRFTPINRRQISRGITYSVVTDLDGLAIVPSSNLLLFGLASDLINRVERFDDRVTLAQRRLSDIDGTVPPKIESLRSAVDSMAGELPNAGISLRTVELGIRTNVAADIKSGTTSLRASLAPVGDRVDDATDNLLGPSNRDARTFLRLNGRSDVIDDVRFIDNEMDNIDAAVDAILIF